MANEQKWKPGELITASKLNAIEDFLTNIDSSYIPFTGTTVLTDEDSPQDATAITGNLTYVPIGLDLEQENNNVTATIWPSTNRVNDSKGHIVSRFETSLKPDGSVAAIMYAQNLDNTEQKNVFKNKLELGVAKNGDYTVEITDAARSAWRRALGIIDTEILRIDNAVLLDKGDDHNKQTVLTPLETTYYFGGTTSGGPWAAGKDKALLRNFASSSSDVFIPTVSMASPNGSWTIGTYRDNSLRFVYYNNSNPYYYAIDPNGVFSGTASKITSRTLTIGNTGKSFNGTANVSWSLSEIGAAAASHSHSATNITSGTLPVVRGGTGAGSPSAARANLEAAALNHKHTMNDLTGTLQIEKGGTGAITKEAARTALGITPANIGAAAANHTHSYLPLSGGTMTGTITLANTGFKTPNAGGYVTDDYGNFKHQSTTNTNTWTIMNKAGTGTFAVNFESGVISKGTWQSTAIGTSYGGTGATSLAAAKIGYTQGFQIGGINDGNNTVTLTFPGNFAVIYAMRGDNYTVGIVDVWTANANIIASHSSGNNKNGNPSNPSITKNVGSHEVLIRNRKDSGAIAGILISYN